MKSVIKKIIPVTLAALLAACGGGGGGSDSAATLDDLTYSGKDENAKITNDNKNALAAEVVDFARSFITLSRFQNTEQQYLVVTNDPAAFWFDEDLYAEDLQCSTGTYQSSLTGKDDDITELNFSASLNKCVVDLDGDIFTYTGKLNLHEYKDTNSDFNLYKDNYDYDMTISFDGTTISKKARRIDESYDDHKGNGAGDYTTSIITVLLDVYSKSYKYTMNKDDRYIKGPSGKVFKSTDLLSFEYDDNLYSDSSAFSLENGEDTAVLYLPSYGKVFVGSTYGDMLKLCENDNFEAGSIYVYSFDDSFGLKINYTECGKYTVEISEVK